MNGYIAFWKGQRKEVYAESSYQAQIKAAKEFGAKNNYDVDVHLAETDVDPETGKGDQVVHLPLF